MREVTLADIALSITDGKHGDCEGQDDSGYYFISCKDVKDGRVLYEQARQITESDFLDAHKRTRLEPNDILITNSGTIGRMAFIRDCAETRRTTFQKSVAIIKPDTTQVLPKYLYYQLQTCVDQFINQSNGSAQKNLLLSTMRAFRLNIHSDFILQRRIADILSAYDDLIENNQKQIKLLEEAAQRLYREWFVDLRFPGHETTPVVEGIPEGWKKGNLSDIVVFKRGKVITEKECVAGSVPVVAGGLEPAYYHDTANTLAPVITVSGSGANAGFVRLYNENVFASDCSFVDSESSRYLYFVYEFLRNSAGEISAIRKGSAQPHVYAKDINALSLLLPKEAMLNIYVTNVKALFEKITVLEKTIKAAKETRDRLLPKLMSGEVEV